MKIVEVDWIDSQGWEGWHDKHEVHDWDQDMHCNSVGYLLKDLDDRIVLVSTESAEAYDNTLCIPKIAIKKIKVWK